jgi:hypothetical protein
MAKKFSKNGKPLGRPSAKGNKNKTWTPEEDNFLKLAVEEKIPKSVVAGRLGRTKNAITLRKYLLKIEGAFGRSKRSSVTKTDSTNPGTGSQYQGTAPNQMHGIQIMKLETGIPVPARFNRNEGERARLRILLQSMKVGQSFVVPKNLSHVAKHIVLKEFEAYKIRVCATSNEKNFYRFFRLA